MNNWTFGARDNITEYMRKKGFEYCLDLVSLEDGSGKVAYEHEFSFVNRKLRTTLVADDYDASTPINVVFEVLDNNNIYQKIGEWEIYYITCGTPNKNELKRKIKEVVGA